MNLDALQQYLELTDQQVTDLKTARETFFTNEVRPLMEQVREKREALRTEMQREAPNAAIVGQLQVDMVNLRNQLKAKHEAQVGQLRAMLTDAQRTKLEALQKAADLMPAIHQARGLSLLTGPEGGPGEGPGFGPMRAFGRRAMRGAGPAR
jgi:hypothetical protein